LPDPVIDQIVDRTDGVPLFVEELTKSVLESGRLREEESRCVLDGALTRVEIPKSLHVSLIARPDRSASVRGVAQIGAAIGREFHYPLLRDLCHLGEGELQAALANLVASEHGGAFGAARLARMAVTGDAPEVVCTPPAREETVRPDRAVAEAFALRLAQYHALNTKIADVVRVA
jgi:hypothetical protein